MAVHEKSRAEILREQRLARIENTHYGHKRNAETIRNHSNVGKIVFCVVIGFVIATGIGIWLNHISDSSFDFTYVMRTYSLVSALSLIPAFIAHIKKRRFVAFYFIGLCSLINSIFIGFLMNQFPVYSMLLSLSKTSMDLSGVLYVFITIISSPLLYLIVLSIITLFLPSHSQKSNTESVDLKDGNSCKTDEPNDINKQQETHNHSISNLSQMTTSRINEQKNTDKKDEIQICSNCGSTIIEGSLFCNKCGSKIAN